ncbi:MAG TPA: N-6 DNA methylase, partial [Nitrospiraceae bacterium]|nr:N-6 DNA methylase [Nitrospiraceae bacterium]
MGNIEDGRLRLDSLKYLPKNHDEFPQLFLREGDILFNRTNSAELVGKTAVYKGKPDPCSFASYLIRVRLMQGCAPDFLAYFINSVFGRAWIGQVVSQQVGQANVNGTKLQALAIPVPPLDEQGQIVAEVERRLSVIDELEATVEANLQDPVKLRRLIVDLIDKEDWSTMSADVKGDAYEGLLEKNAQDTKSGAGQYFTPRPLIAAMVEAIAPKSGETICDPACGTGGFFLAAHDYIVKHYPNLTKDEKRQLKQGTFKAWELVQSTARLCAMNMMLHGIGTDKDLPIVVADSLAADPGDRFDIVMTNPPFGKKSSTTIVGEEGQVSKERDIVERDDFWATTS